MYRTISKDFIERAIRVNHAGEFGAKRIYQGQLKYLKNKDDLKTVKDMYEQEVKHFNFFNSELISRNIRPTLLIPLWDKLGFILGALTSKMGSKAAMACTVAIEEVIEKHYEEQIILLEQNTKEKLLVEQIKKFQKEEIEHKKIALKNQALEYNGYYLLTKLIKKVTKYSIWLSKRI